VRFEETRGVWKSGEKRGGKKLKTFAQISDSQASSDIRVGQPRHQGRKEVRKEIRGIKLSHAESAT